MLRLGILGAGAIGARHLAAAQTQGMEVRCLVDRDLQRAKAVAAQHDVAASDDPEQIWQDDQIDAVVIGVPNCFHKLLATQAMRSGKHVLLEKPMALNAAQCDELVDVAAETGRILQIGFVHRFTAVGLAARRIAASGDLGNVRHAKAQLLARRGIPGLGGWFTQQERAGGGCLIDLGVHLIDLALHLLGQPHPVAVSGKTYADFGTKMRDYHYETMWAGPPDYDGVFDVEDSAYALIHFESGATLDLQVAWACNLPDDGAPPSQVALLGDQGGLSFELFGDHLRVRTAIDAYNAEAKVALPAVDQMVDQLADFAAAIESGAHHLGATPAEGRRVQHLVDAIYESSRQNGPITL
jgi:predicted dehydrogenase